MIGSFARNAVPFVAGLFVACGVVQVFLAGLGVFDDPHSFITHRNFGYMFGWLTLVMLVLSLVGRVPRRITGLSVLLLVLFALQSLFVALRADMPGIAALHPLNGFLILGVGVVTTREAWLARRAVPAQSANAEAADRAADPLAGASGVR
jgi:mercuric ion transport protein